MESKTFTGYLATDSDGWQYLFKKIPKRKYYKNQDIRNIDGDKGEIKQHGEWVPGLFNSFSIEAGLVKILIGKELFNHTWQNNPIKMKINMELI